MYIKIIFFILKKKVTIYDVGQQYNMIRNIKFKSAYLKLIWKYTFDFVKC